MDRAEEALAKKLLATFAGEADEHIRGIGAGLLELERSLSSSPAAPRQDVLERVFRAAHSLKGAAHAVDAEAVAAVCQSLESVFAALKKGALTAAPGLLDLLLDAVKVLEKVVARARADGGKSIDDAAQQIIRRLDGAAAQTASQPLPPPAPATDAAPVERRATDDNVRIPLNILESILVQVEELRIAKLAAGQRAAELDGILAGMRRWKKEWAKVLPEVKPLEKGLPADGPSWTKLAEFLRWNEDHWNSLEGKLKACSESVARDARELATMADGLHSESKKTLMFPFSSILEAYPRLVRDMLRAEGKEADLSIERDEISVDRRILQEIKDPLLHLIRNSIDHGLETPAVRAGKGKPPRGRISISISNTDAQRVEIRIADDGNGLDLAKIRSAALRLGLFSPEELERFDAKKTASLIFQSGISTAPIITSLSGRGLGLAIVRERVLLLNGTLEVESTPGEGTTFILSLPHTLSSYRAILVRVGPETFGVPTAQVDRTARVRRDEVKTVENQETISRDGRAFPLVRLGDILGIPPLPRGGEGDDPHSHVLIAGAGERRVAFAVDELLEEQEVLTKGLCHPLSRVRNVGGVAVLGSGKVIAMLNVADLLKSAVRTRASSRPEAPKEEASRQRTVLVAEDSITTRSLLKNILEAAGYRVTTAVDGMEAFATLRTQACDVVVSDVDMPRMSGFDLTAKIRADKRLAKLPVVLVTSLASREDRERGIDAGADAYIVKGSFEQSDLLAALRRLMP